MNDKQKTMILDVALAAFEALRENERKGSARETRLGRSEDRINLLLDCYLGRAWPPHDLELAGGLVDEFNDVLKTELRDAPAEAILHVGMSMIESVRFRESGPRRTRLDRSTDYIMDLLRPFNIDNMPPPLVSHICRLGDAFEGRIADVFGGAA